MKLIESLAISPKVIKAALALSATGILVTAGGSIAFAEQVATTISLDVNPSIEITANEADEVIEVTALNEDAETVIGDMDLEDVNVNVAMNAIIGSMVQNGYIDETKNAVLVTVENEDADKQQELEALITTEITESLAEDDITPTVFTQEADSKGASSSSVKAFAKEHGISANKAAFIQKILRENDGLSEEELVAMNVEALSEIIRSKNIDLHDSVGYSDEALTKATEKAAEKAEKANEKQAAAAVKETEKQAKATIKAEESQAQAVEKQANADAKATEKQAEANANAVEAQVQADEKQAAAEAKAAEQQAEAEAKAVEAQRQAEEKQAAAEAKAAEQQAQAEAKQAEADVKAAEQQAEAAAKANAAQTQAADKQANGNGNSAASGKKGATTAN